MTLVIDWSKPRTKEEISVDIMKILSRLPNEHMKGFNANNEAKKAMEELDVPAK